MSFTGFEKNSVGGSIYLKAKSHFLKGCKLTDVLKPEDAKESTFTGTKVVGTLGPSCHEVSSLMEMLSAGMVGGRIDLTWGSLDFHKKSLANLQVAMKQARRLCCTVVDTMGREIMVRRPINVDEKGWPSHEEAISIKAGSKVTLTSKAGVVSSDTMLPITYDKFYRMASKGDTVYIGRYLVSGADAASLYLEVDEVIGQDVVCIAKNDAVLEGLLTVFHTERSSNTVQNLQNDLPLLTQYDKDCLLALSKEHEIDFISLSYTRCADDIREARRFLDSIGMSCTKVLAKVETRQALLNFHGIVNEADGVIISRGNLGLDVLPEKMALVQKTLMQACNLVGKPVLITRVVDTMVNTPRPTRAEATDVANAVLDGVDGILLGAETLRGRYPALTVSTICSICRSAERVFDHAYHYEHLMEIAVDAVGYSAVQGASCPDSEEESASISTSMTGDSPPDSTPGVTTPRNESQSDLSSVDHAAAGRRHVAFQLGNNSKSNLNEDKGLVARSPSGMHKVGTLGANLNMGMAVQGMAAGMAGVDVANGGKRTPYLSKLESIASSAVRTAERIQASLILVYTHTGQTAQLVAKYRPPMPILTLVVPHLVSNSLNWKLEGRANARQCLLNRGLMPMLSAPSPSSDAMMEEAIGIAARIGMVKAHDHVVCVQRVHEDFCVKVISVDDFGRGVKRMGVRASFDSGERPLPHSSSQNFSPFGGDSRGTSFSGSASFARSSVSAAYDSTLRSKAAALLSTLSTNAAGVDIAAVRAALAGVGSE